MLNDDASAFLSELVCSDKFLADGFRELCALYLHIGPHEDPRFAGHYAGPGTRLKTAIHALADYVDNTAVTVIISQTFAVSDDDIDIRDHCPLWRLIDECNLAVEEFGDRHGDKGIDEFFLIFFFTLRLQYSTAMIWTLVGDQCLLIATNGIKTESMPRSRAVHYMVAAHYSYIFAEQNLLGALDGVRHLMAELSALYDHSVRPVRSTGRLLGGLGHWARWSREPARVQKSVAGAPSKETVLAPYVASELLLFDVIDAIRRRLALFERQEEV